MSVVSGMSVGVNRVDELDKLVICYVKDRHVRVVTRHTGFLSLLTSELTFRRRVRVGGRYETEVVETFDLTRKAFGMELICPSAFSLRMIAIAKRVGCEIQVVDVTRKCLVENIMLMEPTAFRHVDRYWPTLRDWQRDALRVMRVCRWGRVRVSTGGGKSHLIATYCDMAYTSKILITTAGIQDLKNLRRACVDRGLQVGILTGSENEFPDARVLCCSTGSLERVAGRRFDVVLSDEVHTQAAFNSVLLLGKVKADRMFGFSANQDDREDNADLWLEGYFGPVVLSRTYKENLDAKDVVPIHVKMVRAETDRHTKSKNPYTRDFTYVINNQARNELIAKIARRHLSNGKQVLILVRTTEHCLRIRKFLPEAVVAFKPVEDSRWEEFTKQGLTREGELRGYKDKALISLQRAFADQRVACVIANSVWHKGKDFPPLDVLIRGDAMATCISNTQISGRLSRVHPGKEFGLLIDFEDHFDSGMQARSLKRIRFYRKQGWKLIQ